MFVTSPKYIEKCQRSCQDSRTLDPGSKGVCSHFHGVQTSPSKKRSVISKSFAWTIRRNTQKCRNMSCFARIDVWRQTAPVRGACLTRTRSNGLIASVGDWYLGHGNLGNVNHVCIPSELNRNWFYANVIWVKIFHVTYNALNIA